MWPLEVLSLQEDEREASGQDSQGSLGPGACGLRTTEVLPWASQGALVVKNLPANAGDATDMGTIPGSGRSLEEGMATHSSIPAWRIPWTEEPGGLQATGLQSQA